MDLTVTHDAGRRRYEARSGGEVVGVVDYYSPAEGGALVLTHTGVPPQHEGKGIASKLVREVLDDVRAQGRTVVPACSFVAAFVQRHREEYGDLVAG
ncbi:GNAT family N-acetyltransferase [Kineococcus sp. NUM-3379]